MEIYESKRVAELVERMAEAQSVHDLARLYLQAENELYIVYQNRIQQLFRKMEKGEV